MSTTPVTPTAPGVPRRVRHQAREAAAVMLFSAGASLAFALALLLLTRLGS